MASKNEFEIFVNVSQYDIYKTKHYFYPVFSIDDDNNLYCDNKLVNIDSFTNDLTYIMYDVLISNKKNKRLIKER